MIAFIAGKLAEKHLTEAVIDVHGVGYQVLLSALSYEALPEIGEPVHLFTYLHVREDQMLLFGFATREERSLFKLLISVSGIGPRLALAMLSAMNPAELQRTIVEKDIAQLKRIPGIGKRTAERLVVELHDRLASLELGGASPLAGTTPAQAEARADALAALEALGLPRAQAEQKLRKVLRAHPDVQSAETLIRLALRTD